MITLPDAYTLNSSECCLTHWVAAEMPKCRPKADWCWAGRTLRRAPSFPLVSSPTPSSLPFSSSLHPLSSQDSFYQPHCFRNPPMDSMILLVSVRFCAPCALPTTLTPSLIKPLPPTTDGEPTPIPNATVALSRIRK